MSIAAHSLSASKTSSGRAPGAPSRAGAERPADFAAMVAPQRDEPAAQKPADRAAGPARTGQAAQPQRAKPLEDGSTRAGSARSDGAPAPSSELADPATTPAPDAAAQGPSDAQGSDKVKDAATEAALAEAAAVDEDNPKDEASVAPADPGAAVAASAPVEPAAPSAAAAPPVPVPPAPTATDVPPAPTPEQAAIGAAQGRRGAPRTADAAATVTAKRQPSPAGSSEAASDGAAADQPQTVDGQQAPAMADGSAAPAEAKTVDPKPAAPAGAAAPDLSRLGDGAPTPSDPAQPTPAPPAGLSAAANPAAGGVAAKEAGKPAGSAERPVRRGVEDASQTRETTHDGKPGAGSAAETFQALVLDTTAPTGAGKPAADAAGSAPAGPAADPRSSATTPTPLSAVPIEIGMRAMAGAQSFQIRLHPEEYGRVDVKLDIDRDGAVSAQLVVDRVETLTLLQRDAKTLERAFEQAGLKTAENAVQFSLSSNNGGQNPHQDQAGRQPGGRRVLPPDGDGAQAPAEISAALRAFRSSSGGLDIRI